MRKSTEAGSQRHTLLVHDARLVAETDLAGTLKPEYVFFDGERVPAHGATGTAAFFIISLTI